MFAPLRRLRGLYLRLALVAIAAAVVAVVAVYVLVVPQLQGDLERQRLQRLFQESYQNQIVAAFFNAPDTGLESALPGQGALGASTAASARVSVWEVNGQHFTGWADSSQNPPALPPPVARRAAVERKPQKGYGALGGRRVAQVSYTLHSRLTGATYLVLFSAPVDDIKSSVSLVERRILTAAAIALVAAALIALAGSYALTRRLRRLQRAASRLSRGSFDDPVVDTGSDEIADLAGSIDTMRIRLGQLEQARRNFIANASHELRTPLTALGGFLELASEHDADPAARDGFLQTMREQVDRLQKLATDLLDLSRLDAGGVAVEHDVIDLSAIAEDCVREALPFAQRRDSQVLTVVGQDDIAAIGDDARVRQVLRALLDNALKHTPRGSRIVVTVETVGERAVLEVVDNGPGIPEADQARLFERFYRARNAAPQGSGLGLAIAAELAQRMGGRVEVRSQPGETRFALSLPLAAAVESR
jgi:signal transduction histidine kinase